MFALGVVKLLHSGLPTLLPLSMLLLTLICEEVNLWFFIFLLVIFFSPEKARNNMSLLTLLLKLNTVLWHL